MYTKREARQIKEAFWTSFGKYMKPIPSAEGININWINYKTGIRHLYFRSQADTGKAEVMIEMKHPDQAIRNDWLDKFIQMKVMLENELREEWIWESETIDEYGFRANVIKKELQGVNIYDRNQWPELISFFKPRLMALDAFWSMAKYHFQ